MKTEDTHKNTYIQDRHTHKQNRERGNSQTAEIKGKKKKKTHGFERSNAKNNA